MRRDVFQAIADPTRRTIIHVLAQKRSTMSEVAENFDMSLPAISKHMKILAECGLVVIEQEGRDRYCEARLEKLVEVSEWVNTYQAFWNSKLGSLKNFMEKKYNKKTNKNGKA
jgi:DNA-binding transcriptional ArsR family regulator